MSKPEPMATLSAKATKKRAGVAGLALHAQASMQSISRRISRNGVERGMSLVSMERSLRDSSSRGPDGVSLAAIRPTRTVLTAEFVRSILDYDQNTGVFSWKVSGGRRGLIAGYRKASGYIVIGINKRQYRAHRLAWLSANGEWPLGEIDHKNGVFDDNRLCNLRDASKSQNQANKTKYKNNTSGVKGVFYDKVNKNWVAQINVNRNRVNLGRHTSIESAATAYAAAARKYFGEFARAK
jgi:hypothetical protein